MDLDLRKVRYFAAVAEHLNFGRAAEALHIAQPVLSRQIRALEHELKVQHFERDNRSTRLTPAGEALLEDARTLLPAADATRRRVRDVAAGQRTFTVGFMPGLIVTSAVRELSRRHPGLSVEVFRTDWTNQTDLIRDGRVDIGYLRLPADARGLAIEPLFSEPRVVVLPADHGSPAKMPSRSPISPASTCCRTQTPYRNGATSLLSYGEGSHGRRYRRCGPWKRSWSTSPPGTESSCSRCPPPRSTPAPTSATSPSQTSPPTRCPLPGTAPAAAPSSTNTPRSPAPWPTTSRRHDTR